MGQKSNQKDDKQKEMAEATHAYLDNVFARCAISDHTGQVSVTVNFFKGAIQSAKATWDEGIIK